MFCMDIQQYYGAFRTQDITMFEILYDDRNVLAISLLLWELDLRNVNIFAIELMQRKLI